MVKVVWCFFLELKVGMVVVMVGLDGEVISIECIIEMIFISFVGLVMKLIW